MIQIYKTLLKLDNKKYTTQMIIEPHKLIIGLIKKRFDYFSNITTFSRNFKIEY